MATIFLIRHGEIPQSTPQRFIGQRDLPLTDRGKEQIARLAPMLAARSVERVFCSPLTRCLNSARIICLRLGYRPDIEPALKEISLGSWEGLRVGDVRARYPGEYEARGLDVAGFRPAGGESFSDLQKRVWPAFEAIVAKTDTVSAVVAHAGVNRVILCTALGMPLANLFRIEQTYGCLNIIETGRQGFRVKGLNRLTIP
ncbi:histidine phosphatase family protein [Desulfofustis glycolicus]|uniref:Probable phosphoglycerate mutase n=1 Tax=Desulfofustis glycolicus DSM 9705 TaxID=1121409 RepID=A0A1M5S8N8_9BACT|nr:histidine phosphatase family protein [Desulfofustis glycolicus]MCB2216208.1 histidine phosphatase family protein [Desulfobulbaceae bacterium]SHH34841.1 probable phosphoglycerate mutase [Desulfofustis glycolicus DSM 9705]